jgi:hypothetical protein
MLDEADAKFKQGSALTDLSTATRNSVNGLRPELSTGATNTLERGWRKQSVKTMRMLCSLMWTRRSWQVSV